MLIKVRVIHTINNIPENVFIFKEKENKFSKFGCVNKFYQNLNPQKLSTKLSSGVDN